MIRAAVVGLGIGMAHVAGYLASEHASLVAVCDLMESRRSSVGGTFKQGSMLCLQRLFSPEVLEKRWEDLGVAVYDTIEEVLADDSIDLVSICTPDYLHPAHVQMAVQSRKHILLEKPLALTCKDARAVSDLLVGYDRFFGIGYEFRLNPAVKRLRDLVASGTVGTVEAFSLHHFRTPFRRDKWNHWIQRREYSGGLVVEETCHWFDLARYITGKEIDSVHCVTADGVNKDFDFEDVAFVQGTYTNGGIWQISHALTGFDFSLQIVVHGTQGTLWCALKEDPVSLLDGRESSWLGIVCAGTPGMMSSDVDVRTYGWEATEPENIKTLVQMVCERIATGADAHAAGGEAIAARDYTIAIKDDGLESLSVALHALESADESRIVRWHGDVSE